MPKASGHRRAVLAVVGFPNLRAALLAVFIAVCMPSLVDTALGASASLPAPPPISSSEPGRLAPGSITVTGAPQKGSWRPFTVFRNPRWRPTQAPPGGVAETLTYVLFALLPLATVAAMAAFFRRMKHVGRPATWPELLLGNTLVLTFPISLLFLGGETYFRFFYDTTDSLGYTKVCERWVQRHWHVNGAGCRDNVEYSPSLQAGKPRISFVGDSFTAGHGVKNVEDRFPNLLRRAHPECEVHVLANVGLDTGAEIILLNRLFAKGYQFDRVVLVYCLNDIGDLVTEQNEALTQMNSGLGQGNWLTRNSYLVNLFYLRYKARQNPYARNYFSFVLNAYKGPAWQEQRERLRQFRDTVQSHGGRLSVVTFPFLDCLGPTYPYAFAHQQLNDLWRELGVPHLDLLPVYAELPSQMVEVNSYDAHPNEYACRLAAEALDKFLFAPSPQQTTSAAGRTSN